MSELAHTHDPFALLLAWHHEAAASGLREPNAMFLATATPDGRPSLRTVLFRGVRGGGVRFFTNYESRKGRELEANPRAALLFYWETLKRQVRIEGVVGRVPAEESDEYFRGRGRGSQLGAWASDQSRPVPSREVLLARHTEFERRFAGADVPRPPHWGGYRLVPESFEFWVDGADRLHDRLVYVREGEGWSVTRLAP